MLLSEKSFHASTLLSNPSVLASPLFRNTRSLCCLIVLVIERLFLSVLFPRGCRCKCTFSLKSTLIKSKLTLDASFLGVLLLASLLLASAALVPREHAGGT